MEFYANPYELEELLDMPGNTLHYHLNELVDVGLVENRKRSERDREGLYSYYRATSLGEEILTHGVRELIEEEWEAYSSRAPVRPGHSINETATDQSLNASVVESAPRERTSPTTR